MNVLFAKSTQAITQGMSYDGMAMAPKTTPRKNQSIFPNTSYVAPVEVCESYANLVRLRHKLQTMVPLFAKFQIGSIITDA